MKFYSNAYAKRRIKERPWTLEYVLITRVLLKYILQEYENNLKRVYPWNDQFWNRIKTEPQRKKSRGDFSKGLAAVVDLPSLKQF